MMPKPSTNDANMMQTSSQKYPKRIKHMMQNLSQNDPNNIQKQIQTDVKMIQYKTYNNITR